MTYTHTKLCGRTHGKGISSGTWGSESHLISPTLFYSPHTGILEYQEDVPKIPSACITVEDAEMMGRLALQGLRIVIQLKMCEKKYPDADSFNTVAEITGWKYPDEVCGVLQREFLWVAGTCRTCLSERQKRQEPQPC